MADFEIAYKNTAGFEGFYSNDPNDAGGETLYGIARKKNPHWDGWPLVDSYRTQPGFPNNMKADKVLINRAHLFYKRLYWDPIWGDKLLSQSLANSFWGKAVNMGVFRAIQLQQWAAVIGGDTQLSDAEKNERLHQKGLSPGKMDDNSLAWINGTNDIV